MCKKRDGILSTCHKTNKRVGNELNLSKIISLVNIWHATDAYLRSKGYMKSKFQNGKIENLMLDSDSLQKSVNRKCLSFFDIPTRS